MLSDEDLAGIERRFDRVLARKEGREKGTTGVVAMISAMDVPDLLAEVRRLTAQRDKVLHRMARYRADTMLGGQIRDIYNDVVYCAREWPEQDTRLPGHKCALPTGHDPGHICWCGVASASQEGEADA